MAPRDVELQTRLIISCLFEDDDGTQCRQLCGAEDDTQGLDDDFDPVLIADKLKQVGDSLTANVELNDALGALKKAVGEQALAEAFSQGVEALSRASAAQDSTMASEMQLIKASVAVGLYVKRKAPELMNRVAGVIAAFLNTRVGDWVAQQGGWDTVADA